MKTPANVVFQAAVSRGASARGRRPSLRSYWSRSAGPAALRADVDRAVGNPLSRLAVAPDSAGPDADPPRTSGASEARRERKADE